MLDKMLNAIINSEPETSVPEESWDTSYWDTMSRFNDIDTDFFNITAVRTF